ANVSVYEKSTLSSTLSGDFGYYELPVTSKEGTLNIHYTVQDYRDTTIRLSYINNGAVEMNVNLIGNNTLAQYDETGILDSTDYSFHIPKEDSTPLKPKDSITKTRLAWNGNPF